MRYWHDHPVFGVAAFRGQLHQHFMQSFYELLMKLKLGQLYQHFTGNFHVQKSKNDSQVISHFRAIWI